MSLKLLSIAITILVSSVPIQSVNANPGSCKGSAITFSEKEAVRILQDMYYLQSEMDVANENLDKLNRRRSMGYDPYDADSVAKYNKIVNKYNAIIVEKNALSNEYNLVKSSFNATIPQFSPSTNTTFINCMNMAVLDLNIGTSSLNVSSTSLNGDSLRIRTENMRRRLENMNYDLR